MSDVCMLFELFELFKWHLSCLSCVNYLIGVSVVCVVFAGCFSCVSGV